MSQRISISFNKPKGSSAPSSSDTHGQTRSAQPSKPSGRGSSLLRTTTATPLKSLDKDEDSEGDDITEPRHESVIGFTADGGAILSELWRQPKNQEKVIENDGNANWRTRGKVARQQQQQQQQPVTSHQELNRLVERDETSKRTGLQFAETQEVLLDEADDGCKGLDRKSVV